MSVSQRIASLSPEARARFEQRLLERTAGKSSAPAIPIRKAGSPAPLSFAQQRLWFLERLDPDSSGYNNLKLIRMRGPLSVSALGSALKALAERHGVLTTAIAESEQGAVQVAVPVPEECLPVLDLSGLPAADRETEAERMALQEGLRSYNLNQGPFWRARLYRLSNTEHLFLFGTHHIGSDASSTRIVFRELSLLYASFTQRNGLPLDELPFQYADYAAWQHQSLQGETLEGQLRYWKEQLAGDLPVLQVPATHARPAVQTYHGATQAFSWPRALVDRASELSRENHCTLFMLLLAAFHVLLYRCTGQEDVIVGSPVAGRNQPGTEGLVGCFVNTLALRANLSGNPPFRDLLARVRETCLGAYAHQDMPFDKLVEVLQPERSRAHAPIVQVMFEVRDLPPFAFDLPGLECRILEVETGTAKFDLALTIETSGSRAEGHVEYNTDLFDSATIQRFLGHYRTLVEALVEDPSLPVALAPILTHSERDQLLVDWNPTRESFPPALVHELFEAQVRRTPDGEALVCGDVRLTFDQVNRRANQLAHFLRDQGADSETRVAICLGRSAEFPIAALAAWKTGTAYVPLDPSHPPERLAAFLQDVEASVLLTSIDLAERLPAIGARVICLDRVFESLGARSGENPEVSGSPDRVAYVIYTSGSTGRPKGVLVAHRALANHCRAIAKQFGLTPADRALQFASPGVDLAIEEIFPSWLAGSAVYVAPPLPSAAEFQQFAADNALTVIDCSSSYWQEWVSELARSGLPVPPSVRLMVTGSEIVPAEALAAWRSLAPAHVRWMNAYGLTETTITSTIYESAGPEDGGLPSVPIGRPIANTTACILDQYMQPLPIGVPGELYIGGDCLALGYLNAPELTAEKFIDDPFCATPGGRLCRTGDRARYLPDGNIEFLGRRDEQVKIRGFRIEPGEIVAVLLRHPAVKSAAVVCRPRTAREAFLAAYVVLRPDRALERGQLRDFLAARLPQHFIPEAFVFLDRLPLATNGKVDAAALPDPEWSTQPAAGKQKTPRNATETRMARIWEDVLGIASLSIDQDFFELGGHSLLAVRLISRLEHEFGQKIPLAALFQEPTVERLCALLDGPGSPVPDDAIIPLQPSGSGPALFWVHSEWIAGPLAKHLGARRPFLVIAPFDPSELREPYRLEDYASRYVATLRKRQPDGPYFLGGWCNAGVIAYEMARQLREQGHSVPLVVLFDAVNPAAVPPAWSWRMRSGRLRFQLAALRKVKSGGYAAFARERIETVINRLWGRLWRTVYRLHRILGRPLPSGLMDSQQIEYLCVMKYRPRPYSGRVLLFRCKEQPAAYVMDSAYGWGEIAKGIEVTEVPGNHFQMFQEPTVSMIAGQIEAQLQPLERQEIVQNQIVQKEMAQQQTA